jgi:prolyl-tRNA editing enzyme YbaK/EbsC (Cys-tRNA(Pro) deacylase)
MADAEDTERATGFRPGGVCPFGVEGVEIVLDRELGNYESVFPAAGTDATGVPTTLDQLARITGGRVVDFPGSAPEGAV